MFEVIVVFWIVEGRGVFVAYVDGKFLGGFGRDMFVFILDCFVR